MSRQKLSPNIKLAIYKAYEGKSGYLKIPIQYLKMEIDHIIPERVLLNPRENEFEKWREKYNLEDGFDIHGIENLCPSTREFNLGKHDKGLYEEPDAYGEYIRKALIKAKELKPKIEELYEENKKKLDLRNATFIAKVQKAVEDEKIDLKALIRSGLKVKYDRIPELEELEIYEDILKKYKSEGISFYNFGEYFEIKSAIRYSTYEVKHDVDFWLKLLDDFMLKADNTKLKKNLFYEKAYAMFKAEKSWTPIEIDLLEYLKSVKKESRLEILKQISILFNIFYGEFQRNRVKSSIGTVFEMKELIIKHLNENIKKAKTKMRIANLEHSKFLIESSLSLEELSSNDFDRSIELWTERYFQSLNRLIDILENVQFFDFNEIYNFFTEFAEKFLIIKQHPEYDTMFSKIVRLKNNYEGNNSTVSDLMKRGIELYKNKQFLQTIKHFHKVKNIAFNPEKLYDCLFSIYYIGECYNKMGLNYASKYYFMLIFYITNDMDVEYNTMQLTYNCGSDRIAMINYGLNNTFEAIYFTSVSLMLREFYSVDKMVISSEKNYNIYVLIENMIKSYAYSKQKFKKLFETIKDFLKTLDLLDLAELGFEKFSLSFNPEDIKKIEKENGVLFKDSEKERQYSWTQLDINWSIKWDCEFVDTSLSEEFIAYLQIFLSLIEDIDILSPVDIEISLKVSNKFKMYELNGENIVEIPKNKESDYFHQFLALILSIFMEKMIVSREQIAEEVRPVFEIGYFSNFYDEIHKTLIPEEIFSLYERVRCDLDEKIE